MVRPERFELPTLWFVAKYSIQLSYGRTVVFITEPKIDYQAFGCYAIPTLFQYKMSLKAGLDSNTR